MDQISEVAPKQPAVLDAHQSDQAYTLQELGMWVHLFAKRAKHRVAGSEKKGKDLNDARNYLAMMTAALDALDKEYLGEIAKLSAGPAQ
jgi:hypothetical protein